DDDTGVFVPLLLDGGVGAGDGTGLVQGQAHDVEVAAAGRLRGEGDGGVGLGSGSELRERATQRVDQERKADAGACRLDLVDPDGEGEAARRADRGQVGGGVRGRDEADGGGDGTIENGGVRHDDDP